MHKVLLSPQALDDIAGIRDYISGDLHSPQAAEKLVLRIVEKIEGLSRHPAKGGPLSPILNIQTDYRFLICANYLIFYRRHDDAVFVSRVLYGRRDYVRVLFGELPDDDA